MAKSGLFTIYIELGQSFERIPRLRLRHASRKRGMPEQAVKLCRDPHSSTRCRIRSENQLGPWLKVACGRRQSFIGGTILANICVDQMMREVLRRHPKIGIAFQYRLDGRWGDADDMDTETRIECLMYPVGCALFASSKADRQLLAST